MNKHFKHTKYSENGLAHGRGYIYSLQYHLVFCTKYRNPVLKDGVDATCKELLNEAAGECGCSITSMEVMPDHVHLLLSVSPQVYIPTMVKIIKGNTARRLFIKCPQIKTSLFGGHLWNPTYCIVTVSDRTEEQIKTYIEQQKTK
jgi:putative transposase